ncbi:MAG: PilZ domain-containing protein [Candidatus Omnitrophota bacterium]|jgi:c-di-GMP-binding flagellar brake protein YcgR
MREKRRFIRFDVILKAAYVIQKEPKTEKTGVTRDISANGMQLLTGEKLMVGDRIHITLSVPGASNPVHIRAVIVWSRDLAEAVENCLYSAGIDFEKIEEDNKNTFLRFLCSLMYGEDKKAE